MTNEPSFVSSGLVWHPPEKSDWQMRQCNITYRPPKGMEPNWFHRWMQQIAFGFKWERAND